MAFFGHFCVFTLLRGPGIHEKNRNFKNSRIRIVKHPILMMYTKIHENSIKTGRLDSFLPKFTLKFMLFLLYKDFPIYPLDLPSRFGAQNCEKFVFFDSVKKSDFSMSFFKTYLKIQKMTLDPPPPPLRTRLYKVTCFSIFVPKIEFFFIFSAVCFRGPQAKISKFELWDCTIQIIASIQSQISKVVQNFQILFQF